VHAGGVAGNGAKLVKGREGGERREGLGTTPRVRVAGKNSASGIKSALQAGRTGAGNSRELVRYEQERQKRAENHVSARTQRTGNGVGCKCRKKRWYIECMK